MRNAQRALPQFKGLLTGEVREEPLDSIREFVAYPRREDEEGSPRLYLSVKSAEIHCSFPSIDEAPLGLVDLPGLGEINDNAEAHLRGLEDNVDQVLVIMKPSKEKGFIDQSIAANFDQLRTIQRGIRKRGSFIVAAINRDADGSDQESARALQHSFERSINASQATDKIELKIYTAVNPDEVFQLFTELLHKLARDLPIMDKEVFDYVMSERVGKCLEAIERVFQNLRLTCSKIRRTVPLESEQLRRISDQLSRALIADYTCLEEARFACISSKSKTHTKLECHVKDIHDRNAEEIENGLFLGSEAQWGSHAIGRSDYIAFARHEARRIRARLVDSYCDVDIFYEQEIDELKSELIAVFLRHTGNLSTVVYQDGDAADKTIERIALELDSKTHNSHFSHAFCFLTNLKFRFTQNVFYHIYESLEELHNPKIDIQLERRANSAQEKISQVETLLKRLAERGNDQIMLEISRFQDKFNSYLFTCISFFNDFLFREDERRFERDIELLVDKAREIVVPDLEIRVEREVQLALNHLEDTLNGHLQNKVDGAAAFSARAASLSLGEISVCDNDDSENIVDKQQSDGGEKHRPEKAAGVMLEKTARNNVAPSIDGSSAQLNSYSSGYGQSW